MNRALMYTYGRIIQEIYVQKMFYNTVLLVRWVLMDVPVRYLIFVCAKVGYT